MVRNNPLGPETRVVAVARLSTPQPDPYTALLNLVRQIGAIVDLRSRPNGGEKTFIESLISDLKTGRIHLLLAESASGIARRESLLLHVLETASAHGVRVIIVDAGVDSADPNWARRFNAAKD